ncbi:DUF350 domain-containing protein [Flavobacteriaceae bacterium]|nr:DUF350 domain-containing protein [Flavobacteriaceae bacterium]
MTIEYIAKSSSFIFLYIILLLLSKWFKDFFTPYKLNEELTKKDNLAVALTMCGYYFAITAIFIGVFFGPSSGWIKDLASVGIYSLIGIILLNLSRVINDKVILRKFCNIEHLTKNHNVAVGVVQFGTYFATGLIAAGAINGEGGSILTFIAFFILGQVSLFIFSLIYELITKYSIHKELEKNNIAAGIAFSGSLVALGIIIMNGISGDFIDWKENLIIVLSANILAFMFLPIAKIFMDSLVIPNDKLSREIVEDKNIGAGFLEATIAICFALILKIII